MLQTQSQVVIIGAGIGGLTAALRLAHAGVNVTVLERHKAPGGKMRTVQSTAGPIDAGPTVLTMKPVFETLFRDVGTRLEDHVTLRPEAILARHFWSDGTKLDLMANKTLSRENISKAFGSKPAQEFDRFSNQAVGLFKAFDDPMMRTSRPSLVKLSAHVMMNPKLIPAMAPHLTLAQRLEKHFSEPKLAQLFSRYATYVGGRPDASPAILSLIWHAEEQGVWHVEGGMHQLAIAIEALAKTFGASFQYGADVDGIERRDSGQLAVSVGGDSTIADCVLFNGDPRALRVEALGPEPAAAIEVPHTEPRSLSAYVYAFAAQPEGLDLAAHNIFFGDNPADEFGPLSNGEMPRDPTLYICAQDRFGARIPTGQERFEIIMNGAPAPDGANPCEKERQQCQTLVFDRLKGFGLTFNPEPGPESLTTPYEFGQLFPMSNGSLYGRSPHGMMAAFKRPNVRTRMRGLYLVGGGAHPGAGVPMATLCAQHAAEAILTDLSSISTSRQVATHGGTSTGSATMATAPSQSSAS